MLQKLRNIIIITVFIVVVGMSVFISFNPNNKPENIIQKKIHISLPSSAKIVKFDFDSWTKDFDAKVWVDGKDIESLKNELNEYHFYYDLNKDDFIPNFRNTVPWWDMNKNDIEVCYNDEIIKKRHEVIEIWIFIVKQNDGEYYLYCSYYGC